MTAPIKDSALMRQVTTLFEFGVAGDLSDRELLDRFLAADHAEAEAAFTFLVERHGPMVLHVCRHVLGNSHDAQDALQSTFLVLVRRAGSIKNRDSLSSWLFGVALRVARRARYSAIVRRFHEQRAGEHAQASATTPRADSESVQALLEEIPRLPERNREPIVLCHLQGLSTGAAAQRLGCAQGTILSRLARGRERLRRQLTRRGTHEPAELLLASFASREPTALPAALSRFTVQGAMRALAGRTALAAAVAPSVAVLTQSTLRALLMTRICLAGALLATVAVATAVTISFMPSALRAGSQTVSADKGTPRDQQKEGPVEPATGPSPDLEDALYKILKRDHLFNDRRWKYIIRVRDVHGKTLIDPTFSHWTSDKDNEFDSVIQAKSGVLRVDLQAKVVRVVLERAESQYFVRPSGLLHADRLTLDIPIPPGNRLVVDQGLPAVQQDRSMYKIVPMDSDQALALAYSADGRMLASAGFDGIVHLWDMAKATGAATLKGEKSTIRSVSFTPDGKTVASVNDAGLVKVWDVATGTLKHSFPGVSELMRQFAGDIMLDAVAFAPTGDTLAVSGFGPTAAELDDRVYELRILDAKTGRPIWSHVGRGEQACSLAFAPNGRYLARAGWNTVKLWNPKTGEPVRTLNPSRGTVFAVAFTPDGQALVGGGNIPTADVNHQAGLVTIWNVASGQIIQTLEGHKGGVHAVAVAPDGKTAASGGDGRRIPVGPSPSEVRLWEVVTAKLLWVFEGEAGVVRGLAFAPDGKTLVYSDNATIGVIDAQTGKLVSTTARTTLRPRTSP
jgi:RNA polymerase sigma factor (sigma-70 family)